MLVTSNSDVTSWFVEVNAVLSVGEDKRRDNFSHFPLDSKGHKSASFSVEENTELFSRQQPLLSIHLSGQRTEPCRTKGGVKKENGKKNKRKEVCAQDRQIMGLLPVNSEQSHTLEHSVEINHLSKLPD